MSENSVVNFTTKELKQLVEDETSCVSVHKSVYNLQLYPYHLSDIASSIKELLGAKIAKYDMRLNGILLGYKNMKLLTPQGSIICDSCYIHIDIEGDFYIFKPEIDSILTGIVSKKSANHVACLVHRLFNVSVPNSEDESWLGHDVKIGDEVVLRVVFLDLEARLPYIRTKIESIKTKRSKKKNNEAKINLKELRKLNEEEESEEISNKPHKKKDKSEEENYSEHLNLDNSPKKKKKKSKPDEESEKILSKPHKNKNKDKSVEENSSTHLDLENVITKKKKKSKTDEINVKMFKDEETKKILNKSDKNKKNDKSVEENNSKDLDLNGSFKKKKKKSKSNEVSEEISKILNENKKKDKSIDESISYLYLNDSLKKKKKKSKETLQDEDEINMKALNDEESGEILNKSHKNKKKDKSIDENSSYLDLNDSLKKKKSKETSQGEDEFNMKALNDEKSGEILNKSHKNKKKDKSIDENSSYLELNDSLKKKKKKSKETSQDEDKINLNELNDEKSEEILNKSHKNKKKDKSVDENSSIHLDLNESLKKKKSKSNESLQKVDEIHMRALNDEKSEEILNKLQKSKKKNKSAEGNNSIYLDLNESFKKKGLNDTVNGLDEDIAIKQLINDESPKEKKKRKSLDNSTVNIHASPMIMADSEDRKTKKRRSSVSQNVVWDNKELNLYDSDLEKTLNKSIHFNLVKISALNDDNPIKKISNPGEFEEKPKKRKNKDLICDEKPKKQKKTESKSKETRKKEKLK